jgi:segregation and condensation protein B
MMAEEGFPGVEGPSQAAGHNVRVSPAAGETLTSAELCPKVPRVLQMVETLLFASDTPLMLPRLCELAGIESTVAQAAIDELNRQYEASGRTFRIHKVALGFQLYTLAEFAETVKRLYRRQFVQRLSGPALEVLAIIAYKQPATRPEIEKFRGVDCSGPIVTLLERRLITTAGRAHRPGSPFLYRTTREFLRYFGLESLEALPPMEELGAFLAGAMAEPDKTEAESLAMDYDAKTAGHDPIPSSELGSCPKVPGETGPQPPAGT